jgi:uncharacterized membrane protein YhhN
MGAGAIVTAAVLLLALLLFFERRERSVLGLAAKAPLSGLFILAALVQPQPDPGYAWLMLAGLAFCLGGDVFLALPQERMFLLGLVSFLIGHVFYVAAFFTLAQLNLWTGVGLAASLAAGVLVFRWLRPHLGKMFGPVIAYMVVISLMAVGAWTVLGEERLAFSGRVQILAGALCFYVSDIFVARNRFVKPDLSNRLIGLPLYYAGQFLLAFSVGRII